MPTNSPLAQGSQPALTLPGSTSILYPSPDLDADPEVRTDECTLRSVGRRRKKHRLAGAICAAVPQTDQQRSQLPHRKRKLQTAPLQQKLRRSIRQRVSTQVYDPTDPAAIAGYVQRRGPSPDMQSGLPFDTG